MKKTYVKVFHSVIVALTIGAASITSAQARDSFSLGINVGGYGFAPPPAVYYAPPPVYYAPAPVVYYREVPRYYNQGYYSSGYYGYAQPQATFVYESGAYCRRGGHGRGRDDWDDGDRRGRHGWR